MATLRHTRYQAAIIRDGAILLLRCAFRDGSAYWMLPGGGREEEEEEEACVEREVREETALSVRVDGLLMDVPAEPPDGTYVRWRTYLCRVVDGEASPGGGEGSNAELIDVMWLPLADDRGWPGDVLGDAWLEPQLRAIRSRALGDFSARSRRR
jgi:8-oxo-dGTP pyrophosphatase MutT (NUDIX family)